MRLARVRTPDGIRTGEYDDGTVTVDEDTYGIGDDGDATLLAPCEPSACYCVGRNFAATLDQMDYDVPDAPDWFIKPPASVHDPGAPVEYPSWTEELTYAGELAAVIGRQCHDIGEDEVDDAVRGYTILNDLDALDQPGRTARKAFDASAPLGPWIETDVDPSDIEMTTHVGGELRQEATTAQMLFSPAEVVSFLSERYTFRPGDVISFGSPANPGLVEPGEEVEIWYEGVGRLRNTVVEEA
ncbi:fumarylacetoacetate hydrolase family protein [Halopelagius longus]|uniref:2-keto-4-pentenoate hydratase/2-oxohepta-3-ene-1,7-dioic acid hydratase (Catechol pathway) n=1 Tax=Halopelagius longus TaxID=1236180 RepID=A0A1H0Y7B5_9EURY|nr:fumarylacetoacetate hydrolase family protein [Halopelagius longus]RDI72320.1 FAA hydrolase family protein [Halopelagius longus]SDQ11059.1 2-keto-4-pentenoate hydratase/2-oxohepta-3-ene-1,7-dioic acid hydratase (catechol pathway) [Halopelagius longus]